MFKSLRVVAALAWIIPAILLFLMFNQLLVAYSIQETYEQGEDAQAEVLYLHSVNRVDVTYDYVNLEITMADGSTFTKEKLSLPHTLINEMEGRDQVAVRVDREARQPVVITDLAQTQLRIALMNGLISGAGMIFFAIGVFAWNRYLRREGDPAERGVEKDDAEHPAGRHLRS